MGRLAVEILGVRGLDRRLHDKWTHRYLFSFWQTIGERLLGLPRP